MTYEEKEMKKKQEKKKLGLKSLTPKYETDQDRKLKQKKIKLLKEAKEGKLVLENGTDGKPVQLQQEQKEFKGEVDLPEGMEK